MGVQAMVKGLLTKSKNNNTMNPRAFRELSRRVDTIAEDLDKSGNAAEKEEFQNIIATVVNQLEGASGDAQDNITSRIDPAVYSRREGVILHADEKLNYFKAPPQGRSEVMRKATMSDAKGLGLELDALPKAPEGLLRDISDPVRATTSGKPTQKSAMSMATEDKRPSRSGKVTLSSIHVGQWPVPDYDLPARSPSPELVNSMLGQQAYKSYPKTKLSYQSRSKVQHPYSQFATREQNQFSDSGISQVWNIQSEKMHAKLEARLTAIEQGSGDPSFILPISDMCAEDGGATPQIIPLDHTFGELADTVLEKDYDAPLPDFWSKRSDRNQNCVTKSGTWWEWQHPTTRVADVIMKKKKDGSKESIAIEKVSIDGEYVVALVEKDGKEGGMPIEVPQTHRPPASKYLRKVVFPHLTVAHILELQSGEDASDRMFDKRSFIPMTNPIYVEVKSSPDYPTSQREHPEKSTPGMDIDGTTTMNAVTLIRDKAATEGRGSVKSGVEQNTTRITEKMTPFSRYGTSFTVAQILEPQSDAESSDLLFDRRPFAPKKRPADIGANNSSDRPTLQKERSTRPKTDHLYIEPEEWGGQHSTMSSDTPQAVLSIIDPLYAASKTGGEMNNSTSDDHKSPLSIRKVHDRLYYRIKKDAQHIVLQSADQSTPSSRLLPFLTIPYISAQRILHLARMVDVFHLASTHIARQALHLVMLLNDSVNADLGPNIEQQSERITLSDDLMQLESSMEGWGAALVAQETHDQRVAHISQQYKIFFQDRSYHCDTHGSSEQILNQLLEHDVQDLKPELQVRRVSLTKME